MHTTLPDIDQRPDTSLDPEDWDEYRALGHSMVDDMMDHLRDVRSRPVWQVVPEDVRERLSESIAPEGIGPRAAYDEFVRDVLPYPTGNAHPRFWGWVLGSGTPLGALAEFLAATMNPNVSGLGGVAPLVEEQVLITLRELLGFPMDSSAILTSGGSHANLLGLAVGRSKLNGGDVNRDGLVGLERQPVVYVSTQTHFSVEKSIRLLGLGSSSVRRLPVDDEFRLRTDALERALAEDRAAGRQPFAIVGNAAATNTGAIDPLDALADIAARESMWFHIDGAFGAFTAMVPELRPLVKGMERADSLAFDLHKWLLAPIEAGAVFIKDREAVERTFVAEAGYLLPMPGGLGKPDINYAGMGSQLTRGFRALKLWMALKAHGVQPYVDVIRDNVKQAAYLAELVERAEDFELLAPVPLNVVCFRYLAEGLDEGALNDLNRDLVVRLQVDGIAAPSHTVLNGAFAIRVCITNHRTRRDDVELLIRETRRLGREMTA